MVGLRIRAGALAIALVAVNGDARAATCWTPPEPQTVAETAAALSNSVNRAARARDARAAGPAALMLTAGGQRTPYAAGFLLGWTETGARPDFAVVTAVDDSALIAPFVFLGPGEDATMAQIVACGGDNMKALAERAAAAINSALLDKLAAKHKAGGRLYIALTGSAARPDTMWNIGGIAAGGGPKAVRRIQAILRASVNLGTAVEAASDVAGAELAENRPFRQFGLGEGVLTYAVADMPIARYYIIHSSPLPEQSPEYLKTRVGVSAGKPQIAAVDDVLWASRAAGVKGRIAFPDRRTQLAPETAFGDAAKQLFHDTFRRARMGQDMRTLR
ncbi:MAG: hypothetical protein NW215_01790 [Hyphomicrobiales bacterium]|nr:hypothetical protein [Hyphomicrobiales bacterium]